MKAVLASRLALKIMADLREQDHDTASEMTRQGDESTNTGFCVVSSDTIASWIVPCQA